MAHRIITVGRQFGSNGRAIAKRLAEELGVAFYDKELIEQARERSKISREDLEKADERSANPWLYEAYSGPNETNYSRLLPINDVLFRLQSEIIREAAQREDCIIVGRCADYVLKDSPGCRNIFIYAPLKYRISVIQDRYSIDDKEARSMIRQKDKQRKYYYNYYTDGRWGELVNYHLSFDSSVFGVDRTAEILKYMHQFIL